MKMIKLYYNKTTTQFLTYDDGGMPIIQGDDGQKEIHIHFDDPSVIGSYNCRVVIERPDGAKSNEIYATPITGVLGGYYKVVVSSWVAEVEGVLKITTRLKAINNEPIVFGVANIPVQFGVDPDENKTITDTQYEAIQSAIDGVLDGSTPVFFDNTGTDLISNSQQDAIVEVNEKVNVNEQDITEIFDGTKTVKKAQQDANGNDITTTYETKANAISKKSEIDGRLNTAESEITKIKDGTTIVEKAKRDKNGNDIVNTYETKAVVSGINSRVTSLESSKLNKDFTSLIEEVSLSLSDIFVVDKGSGARKVSLGTLASYLSTQELELFTIVEELPNENQNPNTIYLLVTENEDGENQLLEYIWIADQERWELIGSLEVDLSNYYTKTEVNGLLGDKVEKVAGKGLSTNDYTNTDKQSVEKIPTIEQDIVDLENDKVDKNNAITAGTKTKITYDAKGLVTGGSDLSATDIPELPQSKITSLVTDLGNKVTKNADIVGATKPKITYDSKGLVTGGADLEESDIPALPASRIVQTTERRFVTDTEKSTWNGKQNALTAGDGISISGNVISAVGGITVETWDMPIKTLALSDSNKLFRCSWSSDQTLIIPTDTNVPFPIGTMITFLLISTYKVTFSGQSGVALASIDGLVELKTQYAMASLIKIAPNNWQLVGALE